jgi:hypothetical protein
VGGAVGVPDSRAMIGWSDAVQLTSAAGSLVWAFATFQAVRAANRSARVAEQALEIGLQPVLVPSRPEDPPERVTFREGMVIEAPPGGAYVDELDGNFFVVLPLRNVGNGLAVLRAGHVALAEVAEMRLQSQGADGPTHWPESRDVYRDLQRDLYVPPGERGYWQIGVRGTDDPFHPVLEKAIVDRQRLIVTLLYTDHVGGHRSKTQFVLTPLDDGEWFAAVVRHRGIAASESS